MDFVTMIGIGLGVGVIILIALFASLFIPTSHPEPSSIQKGKYANDAKNKNRDYYDVIIVGAGPAGATCAYYLGKQGQKVLLLEKQKFPRDKHCGNAVTKIGIEILVEMGLLNHLLDNKKAHVADSGGFVSPNGSSFVGRSHHVLGAIPAAIACKRILLDEVIAKAAKEAGADLREETPVEDAKFSETEELWTVYAKEGKTFKGRVLVCADGAPSKLATHLGLVTEPPSGTCSRAYVEGGTHNFKADGVVFYNQGLLPGYAALFRHPNDELNFCTYIIPGNPKVTNDDLKYWHDYLMTKDPQVSKALGTKYKIEPMKAGSLRLGGIDKSFSKQLLIVGDAAGMIDPMTGEGIHHAMDGGRIAAKWLNEAINKGNFSEEVFRGYHQHWKAAFGNDFKWSMSMCQFVYRYPILLDAAAAAVSRKGDEFLARWADIMTGRVPKVHLLRPEFVIVIGFELLLLILKKPFAKSQKAK